MFVQLLWELHALFSEGVYKPLIPPPPPPVFCPSPPPPPRILPLPPPPPPPRRNIYIELTYCLPRICLLREVLPERATGEGVKSRHNDVKHKSCSLEITPLPPCKKFRRLHVGLLEEISGFQYSNQSNLYFRGEGGIAL